MELSPANNQPGPFGPQTGDKQPMPRPELPRTTRAVELVLGGRSIKSVAEELKMHRKQIQAALRRRGVRGLANGRKNANTL